MVSHVLGSLHPTAAHWQPALRLEQTAPLRSRLSSTHWFAPGLPTSIFANSMQNQWVTSGGCGTRRGQFVPRLLRLESFRRANPSQTKSRHSQVVASREEKPNLRPIASLAWDQ